MAARSDSPRPWYREGLRFACQPECGACCRNHGNYAYVYLAADEPQAIAEFLDLDLERFLGEFTTLDDGLRVLRMDEPACPFLDGVSCTIYAVRPNQCRTFPFWEENLESPAAWRGLARFCPGIGQGPTHALLAIEGHLLPADED